MAKRTPLVCQQLENISREALGKYQDIIRQYVRRRDGVYALYRRGKLHYVDLASNLRSRLGHHLRDRHQDSWDRFSVYLTSPLTKTDPFMLVRNDPWNAQLIGWWFLI